MVRKTRRGEAGRAAALVSAAVRAKRKGMSPDEAQMYAMREVIGPTVRRQILRGEQIRVEALGVVPRSRQDMDDAVFAITEQAVYWSLKLDRMVHRVAFD